MIVGRDREETIRLTAEALGVPEYVAAEIVAHELGDPEGNDVVRIELDVDDLPDDDDDDDEPPQDDPKTPDR